MKLLVSLPTPNAVIHHSPAGDTGRLGDALVVGKAIVFCQTRRKAFHA